MDKDIYCAYQVSKLALMNNYLHAGKIFMLLLLSAFFLQN